MVTRLKQSKQKQLLTQTSQEANEMSAYRGCGERIKTHNKTSPEEETKKKKTEGLLEWDIYSQTMQRDARKQQRRHIILSLVRVLSFVCRVGFEKVWCITIDAKKEGKKRRKETG